MRVNFFILKSYLEIDGDRNDDRNDDWNGARQRQLQTHDLMLVPQVNDLAATPKIREFVPKGEWREEGLGHYDPLSSHEIDGRSGRGKDSDDVTETTLPGHQ